VHRLTPIEWAAITTGVAAVIAAWIRRR